MFKRKSNPILEMFNKKQKNNENDVNHLASHSPVKSVIDQGINELLNP